MWNKSTSNYSQLIDKGMSMSLSKRLTDFRASFRYKLLSAFTLLTALLSILLGTLYVTIEIRERHDFAAGQLHLLAQQLVYSVRLPLYAENREALRQLAEQAARVPHIHSVTIMSADGKPLADVHRPPAKSTTETIAETVDVLSDPLAISVETAITGVAPPSAAKIGTVLMERETSDLSSKSHRLIVTAACITLIFWLTVSYVCYLVLRRVTKSFQALMEGIVTMQSGNYTSRIDVDSNDEPGKAADAINQLADSLRRREEENFRLNQDLLKTNQSLENEITERIQAEKSVRESEQNLKALLDIMPIGVAWTDPDETVEYLNNFLVERFGYSREEIRTTADWYSHAYPDPDYRNQIIELREKALEAERRDCSYIPMFEARVTCKDGKFRQVITKLARSQKRTVVILIDITDREILQEQLIKAQKLESIGILAGGIAHNFNNALTGVLGFISLASMNLDTSHKSHQLLQHADRATKRAAGMAKQLLTFARGGAPVKKPVSLRKLVEESAALTLNGTNVHPVVRIPGMIHSIMADEDQLCQAFNNITINAVQAMPNGGTLEISAENVMAALDETVSGQQSAYVKLCFADEGHGVPATDLTKIFDPYFTTKASNTGLGLASVHSIIRKHGGRISVDSTVGKGTIFTILLPSTGTTAEPDHFAEESLGLPNQGSGSVLVMDDEEMVREIAKETVRFLGYRVTVCASGEEALSKYEAAQKAGEPYMAVILDLTIPCGMGGVETAKQILAIDPDARLIVSSGYSFDPVIAGYRDYGFCAAVVKPYQAEELGRQLTLLANPR